MKIREEKRRQLRIELKQKFQEHSVGSRNLLNYKQLFIYWMIIADLGHSCLGISDPRFSEALGVSVGINLVMESYEAV